MHDARFALNHRPQIHAPSKKITSEKLFDHEKAGFAFWELLGAGSNFGPSGREARANVDQRAVNRAGQGVLLGS